MIFIAFFSVSIGMLSAGSNRILSFAVRHSTPFAMHSFNSAIFAACDIQPCGKPMAVPTATGLPSSSSHALFGGLIGAAMLGRG